MPILARYSRLNVLISAGGGAVIRAAAMKINPRTRFDLARRGDRHDDGRDRLHHQHDARDLAARIRL
ncbi:MULTISPECIES: hypothetical protein [Paracoccus]|uniref:Uncharacterized protein n=1 Tax=Paracoccus pacificus TaxID=1463598 RepID=A0ABW4R2E2_9RHOB|nr:hypothetical protein [Paracoccus sp. M683]TRW93160.1 hypothetical protein FNJ84_20395 [Paracoccus sp. M683]